MTAMRAAQIMHQPVLAATRKATVRDLITQLVMNKISGMPVVERDGTVVGVVSEDDVVRALVEGDPVDRMMVEDIMSTAPVTVAGETPVPEVMHTMHQEGILRVPVTNNGRLVGIISRGDIIRTVAELQAVDEPGFVTF